MPEKLDPKLKSEWDEKLKGHGLPKTTRREKVPVSISYSPSAKEILTELVPGKHDMEKLWGKFETLPRKIQNDIVVDIKNKMGENKRNTGMLPGEILDRLETLIAKGQGLKNMTMADSDKDYIPPILPKELEREERDEAISKVVNRFIDRAEKKIAEDGPDEPGGPRNIN